LRIEVGSDARQVWVRVSDDGRGLGATSGRDTSFGLSCVRERLGTSHGEQASLTLEAALPRGTVATVRVPLAAP
jgi:signal transduction histidine kinase